MTPRHAAELERLRAELLELRARVAQLEAISDHHRRRTAPNPQGEPMNLLDPKLGAYARLALKILTLAAVIVAAVAGSFPQLAWIASVGGAISVAVSALTHLTTLGNAPETTP